MEPPRISAYTLYFQKLESLAYILPIVWVYLHSFFSGGLHKTIFSARVHFCRLSSPEVIDFSANRKRVCDFLLVGHSNLGLILHRFRDIVGFVLMTVTPPLFHPNFGCVPVRPDRRCWGQPEQVR